MRFFALITFTILSLSSLIFAIASETENENSLDPWVGRWRGVCKQEGYNSGMEARDIGMSLEISKVNEDNFSWQIQYEGEGVRRYNMLRQNDLPGHWVLDENSGILIDRFLVGDVLSELYSINGRIFTNKMTLDIEKKLIKIKTLSFWAQNQRVSSMANGSNTVHSFALRDLTNCTINKE